MFSQLRNAVEQLAQQPVRVVSEAPSDHNSESAPRTASLDVHAARSISPLSSSELAESALSSLRKSLSSQRTTSSSSHPAKTPSPAPPENTRPRKSNLEERLRRATYAIGDASTSSTSPRPNRVASPSPMGANRRPMPKGQDQSAYSTPLPASPMVVAAIGDGSDLPQPSVLSLDEKTPPQEGKLKKEVTAEAPAEAPAATQKPQVAETKFEEFNDPLRSLSSSPSPVKSNASVKAQLVESELKDTISTTAVQSSAIEETHPLSASSNEIPSPKESPEDQSKPNIIQSDITPSSSAEVEKELLVEEPSSSMEEQQVEEELLEEEKSLIEDELEVETGLPVKEDSLAEEDLSVKLDSQVIDDSRVDENVKNLPFSENSQIKDNSLVNGNALVTVDSPVKEDSAAEDMSAEEDPSIEEGAPVNEDSPVNEVNEDSNTQGHTESQTSTAVSVLGISSAEVESLQARLKQVEQRFTDVSTSFKRLQAEKLAADAVLREVSPLESIKDADALREFFCELKAKDKVFQDEIKRLNQKLELQEDRFEEMRDTHRLESHSRSDEVKKIRTQLDETEKLFQAAQRATTHAEEVADKRKEEIARLHKEVEKSKNTAKEEEEKRVKAISLLKTVRQKLVKAEKEKEDTLKELNATREREKGEKDKEHADRMNFQQEIENLNASHDKAIANLKAQFNKDFGNMRERYEQETSSLRGQFTLDLASSKNTHAKELGAKSSQITTLENSLNNVTRDKNAFFDQLQLRQAELESAQGHLESLQHQNTEFQFQLRESNDRMALLKEEASELLREQQNRARDPTTSADEIARMVSATEAKYESRLAEMKRNLTILEKERYESEADWSRKLKEKVKELEDLKRVLGSATRTREADESVVARLKADLQQSQDKVKILDRQVSELPLLREQIHELEKTLKEQDQETGVKIHVLEKQLEETKNREAQMKQSNKTLREELRKVQSSAALLERQRNPGVGYWTTRIAEGNGAAEPRSPNVSSPTESSSRVSSPTPSTAPSTKNEEEVNLEYLRNVILQFLEHKEMRPNLVKVLSIILHFTPQETRRLIAKV